MIGIRKSSFNELKDISDMGSQNHVLKYLGKKTLETHERDFVKNTIIYLSILSSTKQLAGYIILCLKIKSKSVQLKRILVSEKYLGIGQEAIIATENYCVNKFNCSRIWLDVYGNNLKARYIYEKLDYKKFRETTQHGKTVLFYEKTL